MRWPDPPAEDGLLVELIREGNREQAERLHRAWKDRPAGRAQLLRQTVAVSPAVFAPVVCHASVEHSPVCRLTIDPQGRHSPTLTPDAVRSLEEAFDQAWNIVGGKGPRPSLGAHVSLSERLNLPIEGSSFHLAGLFAATSHFSGVPLPANVLATGHFEHDIHNTLGVKVAMSRRRFADLHHRALLVASKNFPSDAAFAEPDVHWCRAPSAAVQRVFGAVPWSRSADALRLHFHSSRGDEKARPPSRGDGWQDVPLPHPIRPDDLPNIVEEVRHRLGQASAVEISLAGSILLAFALGWELKNHRGTIVLIHDNEVWWRSGTPVEVDPTPGGLRSPRVLLTTRKRSSKGWGSLDVIPTKSGAQRASPVDVPGALARLLSAVEEHRALDLACDGPWPVAWSAATALRNVRDPVRFFDWQGHHYADGFTGTRFGIERVVSREDARG